MSAFTHVLNSSKNIIAIAGAGLSAASGIPTFRGAGGLWRTFEATKLATPEAFEENPSRVWQFYHYRREVVTNANENKAHEALARFSLQRTRDSLMPENTNSSFTLITQNIDGLSRIALNKVSQANPESTAFEEYNTNGQAPLLEMHGRLFDLSCTNCDHVSHSKVQPLVPALAGTEAEILTNNDEVAISETELPRCINCGALARPGVVWFGEMPLHLLEIDGLVRAADLCIVVGTSSTVYPAAGYATLVQRHGGKVAVFNLERSAGDQKADFLFLGPCEETLPAALGLITTLGS